MNGTIPTLVVPTYETTGQEVDTRFRSLRDTIVSCIPRRSSSRLFAISWTKPETPTRHAQYLTNPLQL